MEIREYQRQSELADIIGYMKYHGEFPSFKDLMDYGYAKADIVDFALGFGVPVNEEWDFDTNQQGIIEIEANSITPSDHHCLCGKSLVLFETIYRVDKEDGLDVVICSDCLEKKKMVEGI